MTNIKQAQAENEKVMLQLIKARNKKNEGYTPVLLNVARYNAIDRLVAKGKIKSHRHSFKSRDYMKTGYWLVK